MVRLKPPFYDLCNLLKDGKPPKWEVGKELTFTAIALATPPKVKNQTKFLLITPISLEGSEMGLMPGGVTREQKMLKGHPPRVIYHQAYQRRKKTSRSFQSDLPFSPQRNLVSTAGPHTIGERMTSAVASIIGTRVMCTRLETSNSHFTEICHWLFG